MKMATDFTRTFINGSQAVLPSRNPDGTAYQAPISHSTVMRGNVSDESSRQIFNDMVAVAERDLTGPALEERIQQIHDQARAAGWRPGPDDQRSGAQVAYDHFWRSTDTAQTGADPNTGYPRTVQPGQVELWQKAAADDPVARFGAQKTKDALEVVERWLATAAAPKQRAELLDLAKRNSHVLRALDSFAGAHDTYSRQRPE
jgi:hypothetical protein